MSGNRRKFVRRALSYPAKMTAIDGSWERNCRIVDVSDGGARLLTAQPLQTGEDFTLVLSNKTTRCCHVMWSVGSESGVRFIRPRREADEEIW
jgi:hypothetical protein